jgi:phage protein D
MAKAPKAVWFLTYENVDISDELAPMVTSIEYTDNLTGKSDEIQVNVENRDGRWINGWYPSEGDRIALKLGWEDQPLIDCGAFKVDEIEATGAPDAVSIHALAAKPAKPVRTITNRAFEDTTLRELAAKLSAELELVVVGDVADVKLGRVTQTGTTLAFLQRLAEQYGYAFSIRPPNLIFYEIAKLDAADAAIFLAKQDLLDYHLKGKTQGTYVAIEFNYFDAQQKKNITVRIEADKARQAVIVGDGKGTGVLDTPPELPTQTLREGSKGDDVKKWQSFLRSRGLYDGAADGSFGPLTRAGTVSFQKSQSITADGVAGPETYRAALSAGYGPKTTDLTHTEAVGNVLRVSGRRAESIEQAQLMARAELAAANRLKVTGSLTVRGRPNLVAGANINLTGLGRLSGKFSVEKSTHRMDRQGGYTTAVDVKWIDEAKPAAPSGPPATPPERTHHVLV